MNERIKYLAEQAGFMDSWFSESGDDCERELKKFAKLIIKDCLQIVNRKEYSYHEADPLWETAQLIKQHFGVE